MVLGVAVTDDHFHILADALCAQSGLGEGGSHGEEIDLAAVTDGQNGGHFAGLDVDTADAQIVLFAIVGSQSSLHNSHGLGAVSHHHIGVNAQLHQIGHLLGVTDNAHNTTLGAHLLHGLKAAQNAGLAVGAQNQNAVALLRQLAGLSRSAGHVQSSQSQRLGHILGHLGVQGGLKQNSLTHDVHTVDVLVDGQDLVDLQGSHGQRNQRNDLVAHLQIKVGLGQQILTDISNLALEHAAGAGHRVLLLAALGHDAHDHFADLDLIAAAGLFDLGEGSGVDVQGGNIADDFVGVALGHIVVDLPCSLGQNALGLDDAMGTVFIAFHNHGKILLKYVKIKFLSNRECDGHRQG